VITLPPIPRPTMTDREGIVLAPWLYWLNMLWRVENQNAKGMYVVSSLPDPGLSGSGARAFTSDSNATTFGEIVAGGGVNIVPVYSDGSAWRIG
jgi:hypothetical protein